MKIDFFGKFRIQAYFWICFCKIKFDLLAGYFLNAFKETATVTSISSAILSFNTDGILILKSAGFRINWVQLGPERYE